MSGAAWALLVAALLCAAGAPAWDLVRRRRRQRSQDLAWAEAWTRAGGTAPRAPVADPGPCPRCGSAAAILIERPAPPEPGWSNVSKRFCATVVAEATRTREVGPAAARVCVGCGHLRWFVDEAARWMEAGAAVGAPIARGPAPRCPSCASVEGWAVDPVRVGDTQLANVTRDLDLSTSNEPASSGSRLADDASIGTVVGVVCAGCGELRWFLRAASPLKAPPGKASGGCVECGDDRALTASRIDCRDDDGSNAWAPIWVTSSQRVAPQDDGKVDGVGPLGVRICARCRRVELSVADPASAFEALGSEADVLRSQ